MMSLPPGYTMPLVELQELKARDGSNSSLQLKRWKCAHVPTKLRFARAYLE
jgi:hypothetical protein